MVYFALDGHKMNLQSLNILQQIIKYYNSELVRALQQQHWRPFIPLEKAM